MNTEETAGRIRILIADDDEYILSCYQEAFGEPEATGHMKALSALDAELFDADTDVEEGVKFDVVACRQGQAAIEKVEAASAGGKPFDVVILDVRMPPGIDGVEAGSRIRELDPDVDIVFVTGFSDVRRDELERRVPPPLKLHYFNKPLSFMKLAEDVAEIAGAHQPRNAGEAGSPPV